MTAKLHKTNVDLTGLLEVLANNLYSTPSVAVRELIQNAHDASIRRKVESPSCEVATKIQVSIENGGKVLAIEDNGAGLTQSEVVNYLATIGSGYTRVLRNASQNTDAIGYFGLGFLSAYVVADKVEVLTTSYQSPNETCRFVSNGGERYSLESTNNREVGTKVILHLKPKFRYLANLGALKQLLNKYCCLLDAPIYLENKSEPINNLAPPWLLDDSISDLQKKKKAIQFATIFESKGEPLCVIPLLSDDPKTVGLIWVHDYLSYETSDYRNVSVFVRDMHVSDESRDLLPVWAGFVSCIINTQQLTPTASREDIQKDASFEDLKLLINESLIQGLEGIAKKEPENWRRILTRHNQTLLGAALSDERLFDVLKDDIKVPTTEGGMTLPSLLKKADTFYISTDDQLGFENILLKAQQIPVVAGYLYAASPFTQRYAELTGIKCIILGTKEGSDSFFAKENGSNDIVGLLQKYLAKSGEEVVPTRFKPEYLPLVLVVDQDVLLKERIESDDSDKRIGSAALVLAKHFTSKIDNTIKARIYVNMSSELINLLVEPTAKNQEHICQILRTVMLSQVSQYKDSTGGDFSDELKSLSNSLAVLAKL